MQKLLNYILLNIREILGVSLKFVQLFIVYAFILFKTFFWNDKFILVEIMAECEIHI